MNRYKFLLDNLPSSASKEIIGFFPFGTLIDAKNTSIKKQQLHFLEEGVSFLEKLSTRNVSIVLFFNQLKPPVAVSELEAFTNAVGDFVIKQGLTVIGPYWCPGIDKRDPFVVPNPGMFHRVTEHTGMSWEGIPVISSNELDLAAAAKVKATPIKIGGNSANSKWTTYESLDAWLDSSVVKA